MNFGDRLKSFRTEKKLTQEDLAKKVGVAKTTITGYEKVTANRTLKSSNFWRLH